MRRIIIAILLVCVQNVYAQKEFNPFLYFQIEQSFRAYPSINPGSIAMNRNIMLNAGSQLNGGPFKNNRKYYFQGSSPIASMSGESNHGHIGITFQGEQEGPLLSRNRWNLQYAWSTKLNDTWSLSFGAAIGQINYLVSSTNVSQGGASNILDGHIGGWLFKDNMYFGLSANHIFEGELVPIEQSFRISKVYHFIGGRIFAINPYFQLQSAVTVLYDPLYDEQFDITLLGKFDSKINAGAVIRLDRSLVMIAGLEHLQLGFFSDFSASFSYTFPLGTYSPDIRIYGIDITFELDWVTFPKTSG